VSRDGGNTWESAQGYYFSYGGKDYHSDVKPSKEVIGSTGPGAVDQSIVDAVGRDYYDQHYATNQTTYHEDWNKGSWDEIDLAGYEFCGSDEHRSFLAGQDQMRMQEEFQSAQLAQMEERLAMERQRYEQEMTALAEEKAKLAEEQAEAEARLTRRRELAANGRGGTVVNVGGQGGLGAAAPTHKQKLGG